MDVYANLCCITGRFEGKVDWNWFWKFTGIGKSNQWTSCKGVSSAYDYNNGFWKQGLFGRRPDSGNYGIWKLVRKLFVIEKSCEQCDIFARSFFDDAINDRKNKSLWYEPQVNKSFLIQQFFKNAGEVWASSPHLRSKFDFWDLFFLLQLHFLKLSNLQFTFFCEISCKFRQGNGAIAACWQAKAGVEPPFAGCGRPFSLREVF